MEIRLGHVSALEHAACRLGFDFILADFFWHKLHKQILTERRLSGANQCQLYVNNLNIKY